MTPAQSAPHLRHPPFRDKLPAPIYFRLESMPDNATYPVMQHPWGEFVYSFSGVTELRLAGQHLLAPPHMGFWIPPHVEHVGFNRRAAVHFSTYISEEFCDALPDRTCSLLVTPLLRAILNSLSETRFTETETQSRLLRVMVDELENCSIADSFVPETSDVLLAPVLEALRDAPADPRSNAQLARAFGMSERTLVRRCTQELGMSLSEWRQRVRVVRGISLLQDGASVESVALDLGYGTASAFIAMFRRITGSSPARFVGR
ncbi:AraC family transcriptional regulator [Alloyangia pacifica]|uniref:Transcriptional regulator, AraC family n=1 Tax=Alloyangia pacifica TaxID=311180 RepID=A0A1I6V127_9RHOB|nr:helix-turn-helix transcriptional regulator [Alloyangia pacifica]SDI87627.1 transcriptional regulator, AraC family [Alloyangia pacifica]SFT07419.1 transcriptional regulator, AraC family [Alloyangia pacifica]